MVHNPRSIDERQTRLEQVIADFLEAVDEGQAADPSEWIAQFPELNPELADFFADQQRLDRAVQPVREDRDRQASPSSQRPVGETSLDRAAGDTSQSDRRNDSGRSLEEESPAVRVGRRFGDYEIEAEIGQGGAGIVYRAMQLSLNRTVAIKVLRAGLLATGDERQRFQNEAEAVAQLDHPNIVGVYEVGDHEDRAYFSMKFIAGGSLSARLAEHCDDPAADARLMVTIAEAVHHAHQRGVLHRDLKPANILIDDDGQPHVSDFGLAKRVKADHELTEPDALIGTPAYMAPEQADQRPATTATDVYGLGSVLFALLAGRAPFSGDSLLDTLQKVRTQPPDPPQTFNAKVPRDLQVMCLKCLEKDPERRYPSAQALADDLSRWLNGEPITARPVGRARRVWLWSRRNRWPATAAALVTVGLLAWVFTSTVLWRRAERESSAARASELKANQQREVARTNERIADENFHRALDVIDEYLTRVSDSRLLGAPGLQPLREELLQLALGHYQSFIEQHGESQRLRLELADAYSRVGRITSLIGSTPDAIAALEEAQARFASLCELDPGDIESHSGLAFVCNHLGILRQATGELDLAAELFHRAAAIRLELLERDPADHVQRSRLGDTYHNLARLEAALGHNQDAQDWNDQAILERTRVLDAEPTRVEAKIALARSYNSLGELQRQSVSHQAALISLRGSRELWTELFEQDESIIDYQEGLADVHHNIALTQHEIGEHQAAAETYNASLAIRETLVEVNPTVRRYQLNLAKTQHNLGLLAADMGDHQDAILALDAAIVLRTELADNDPMVDEYRGDLARTYVSLAKRQSESGRRDEAIETYQRAAEMLKELTGRHPRILRYQADLANSYNNLADLQQRKGQRAEALQLLQRTLEIREGLVEQAPETAGYQNDLGATCNNLGLVYMRSGELDDAERSLRRSIDIRSELVERDRGVVAYWAGLANGHHNLGVIYSRRQMRLESLEQNQRAIEIRRRLVQENTKAARYRSDLGLSYYNRAAQFVALKDWDRAIAMYRESVGIRETLLEQHPEVPRYREDLARSLNNLASALRDRGDSEEAAEQFKASIELRERLVSENEDAVQYQGDLAKSYWAFGLLRSSMERWDESIEWLTKSIAVFEAMRERGFDNDAVRAGLSSSFEARAAANRNVQEYKSAISDLDEAISLIKDADRIDLRMQRAHVNALAGLHAEATSEAEELLRSKDSSGVQIYEAAKVYSLSAALESDAHSDRLASELAARAVKLLTQARDEGYFHDRAAVDRLNQDASFDPIRSRETFVQFIESLNGASPSASPSN